MIKRKRRIKNKKYVKITVMKKIVTVIFICTVFFSSMSGVSSQEISAQERARLEAEYNSLKKEIADLQKNLDALVSQKNTLKGDVSLLTAQIAKAEKEIKQRNITLTTLNSEINKKITSINFLEKKITNDKKLLANLLKKKNQNEVEPIFYLLLSSDNLSELITDIDNISSVNQGLQDLFVELGDAKAKTLEEKEMLDDRKNKELDAKYEVELKKKEIAKDEADKKKLLNIAIKTESNYQQVLADRQRKAEAIRSALFDLRDAGGISFAKALEYANYASVKTGVRSAMILAILSQESDLGKNIGSCYVSNLTTGDGVGKNTGSPFQRVMYAPLPGSTSNRPNDAAAFQKITSDLGLVWATTPVSCPLGAVYYVGRGFGGAMGPSQFIPSTWQGFVPRLKNVLGVSTPNPWDPKHAIMATALYIADLGAGSGTYTAERNAACKYYSGAACTPGRKPANTFYGDQVIAKAEKFQNDIDFLKNI